MDCPLTRVASVPEFFRAVGIPDDADLVVSCDTGQGRTLVTVQNVSDEASEIFVLASLEGADEITPNVRMILHKLGFPDFNFRYQGTFVDSISLDSISLDSISLDSISLNISNSS